MLIAKFYLDFKMFDKAEIIYDEVIILISNLLSIQICSNNN